MTDATEKIKVTSISEYNKAIKFLIGVVIQKAGTPELQEVADKVTVAINITPTILILRSGPYVWKYREPIHAGNIDALLNNDYVDDVRTVVKETNESEEHLRKIIAQVKTIWKVLEAAERKMVLQNIQKLLQSYSQYLRVERVERK